MKYKNKFWRKKKCFTYQHLEELLWSLELQWAQGAWISRITPPTSLSAGQITLKLWDTNMFDIALSTFTSTPKSTSTIIMLPQCNIMRQRLEGALVSLWIHRKQSDNIYEHLICWAYLICLYHDCLWIHNITLCTTRIFSQNRWLMSLPCACYVWWMRSDWWP